jgi:hypothetical protein
MMALRMIAGFLVWASALSLLYGYFSLACAWGFQDSVRIGGLLVLWAAHMAAGGIIVWLAVRRPTEPDDGRLRRFMHRLALGSSLAALAAVVWTGLPVVFASPTC